jgi:hypothetical protein
VTSATSLASYFTQLDELLSNTTTVADAKAVTPALSVTVSVTVKLPQRR